VVETGGLENRCTGNGTGGSNPSPSAIQSELQRNRAALLQESLKIAPIPQVLSSNRTGESVQSNPAGKFSGVFLWRAQAQSGFSDSSGECNAINR
jgi:hypothetical protein